MKRMMRMYVNIENTSTVRSRLNPNGFMLVKKCSSSETGRLSNHSE